MNHWKIAAAFALFVCAAGQAEAQERRRPEQRPAGGPGKERLLQRFDTNKDGKLDEAERAQIKKALGQHPGPSARRDGAPKSKDLLKRFDTNKDGKLDDAERAQARKALGHRRQPKPGTGRQQKQGQHQAQKSKQGKGAAPNLKHLLSRFDTNKDGKLDDAEKQRARDLMQRAKKKIGVNGNGEIGPRERARGRDPIRRRRGATPPPKRKIDRRD